MPGASADQAPADPPPETYIRGVGGGRRVDARRVAAVLVALSLLVMLAISAQLTVSAMRHNDQIERLRNHGVPVPVTVTGCLGISSGIAFGLEFWQCSGTYTFAGHTHEEVIGGSRTHLRDGQVIEAVADPGRPTVVWTTAAIDRLHPTRAAYIAPVVLTGIVVMVIVGWVTLRIHRRRKSAPPVLTLR